MDAAYWGRAHIQLARYSLQKGFGPGEHTRLFYKSMRIVRMAIWGICYKFVHEVLSAQ